MLNVVTVHWQSSRWIEPQLRYLHANLDMPFRVVASLNGIADPGLRARVDVALELDGTHAEKLNALAAVVLDGADPGDRILFIDGDAFPVRPIGSWLEDQLGRHPLIAVQRRENLGDLQPHPCFCVTTCGLWAEIDGDWREGGTWTNAVGQLTTDVGGTLLHQLADRDIDWLPLLRTNTRDDDPLWFGVYGHRVYHHGAGFRPRSSRMSVHAEVQARLHGPESVRGTSLEGLARRAAGDPASVLRIRPRHIGALGPAFQVTVAKQQRRVSERRRTRRAGRLQDRAEAVFDQLREDPAFYRQFDDTSL